MSAESGFEPGALQPETLPLGRLCPLSSKGIRRKKRISLFRQDFRFKSQKRINSIKNTSKDMPKAAGLLGTERIREKIEELIDCHTTKL
ncbi:hypothetical protein AVEN_224162-1 [Araneus ventricosus]|uniref:Uncharacterized protein n=1 Tax=Araneus ventricosus TaxID=182803 RepID=A0A4Y2SUH3_ARAVE|nr:hypothetical protein AVEN_114381-1 [Araneus ventricosus]GBN91003.1 hypothetical protein AVEN_224162-1 [Araneus ventricosus]